MKVGVVGCIHGELEEVYNAVATTEKQENTKIELLICCGDFEALRNENDLECMATKNPKMGSFYKYYSGEKLAPILTIFIGGNHEASNYLQELPFGGWVAPNIYYLGNSGCVNFGGIRIAGISGIYKKYDYLKHHHELPPYSETAKRSVYHIRQLEVFRLMQLSDKIDICLSHDWPQNVDKFGDFNGLVEKRPNLLEDIEGNRLGSPPTRMLLELLRPSYWFSAHLHSFYTAVVKHTNSLLETNFMALDKCCSDNDSDGDRKFLEIVDVQIDDEQKQNAELFYDLEWLTILHETNHVHLNSKINMHLKLTSTKESKERIFKKFDYNLRIPMNFCRTAQPYNPLKKLQLPRQKQLQFNPQTATFCALLGIEQPFVRKFNSIP